MRKVNTNFVGIYANKGAKNNSYTYMTDKDTAEDVAHIDYFLPMFDQLQVGDKFEVYLLNGEKEVERYMEYLIVAKDIPHKKIYKKALKNIKVDKDKRDNVVDDGV